MKVKIKVAYEWEEDLTDIWEEWKQAGYSLKEFQQQEICFCHPINKLDHAAENHIMTDYKRTLKIDWEE